MFQVDEAGASDRYFAGYTPAAVSPYNAEEFSAIEMEVKNQQEIVQQFNKLPIGKTTVADSNVRNLFARLTRKQTQKAASTLTRSRYYF